MNKFTYKTKEIHYRMIKTHLYFGLTKQYALLYMQYICLICNARLLEDEKAVKLVNSILE